MTSVRPYMISADVAATLDSDPAKAAALAKAIERGAEYRQARISGKISKIERQELKARQCSLFGSEIGEKKPKKQPKLKKYLAINESEFSEEEREFLRRAIKLVHTHGPNILQHKTDSVTDTPWLIAARDLYYLETYPMLERYDHTIDRLFLPSKAEALARVMHLVESGEFGRMSEDKLFSHLFPLVVEAMPDKNRVAIFRGVDLAARVVTAAGTELKNSTTTEQRGPLLKAALRDMLTKMSIDSSQQEKGDKGIRLSLRSTLSGNNIG